MTNKTLTATVASVPPCVMTIFGASGDLTKRLLLPSLYNLVLAKSLPESFRLLGVARKDWDEDKFRDHIAESLKQFWGPDLPWSGHWLGVGTCC